MGLLYLYLYLNCIDEEGTAGHFRNPPVFVTVTNERLRTFPEEDESISFLHIIFLSMDSSITNYFYI